MSSIKHIKIHPSLLKTLQRVYNIKNQVINKVNIKNTTDQDLTPLFNDINLYKDGKGRAVLEKFDEIFNIQYKNKSNDIYQLLNTSFHDSVYLCIRDLLKNLDSEINKMVDCLEKKKAEFALKKEVRITRGIKVDITLEDFYKGYITNLKSYKSNIESLSIKLGEIPLNSLNNSKLCNNESDRKNESLIYDLIQKEFSFISKINFDLNHESANDRIQKLTCSKDIVESSAFCASIATFFMKFANDIRFLSSGPRSGFGEMTVPENEPGSSIMPGKVNPTQCESITMICAQVLGNNNAVNIAASSSMFEGANFLPLYASNTIRSIELLTDGLRSFRKNCMEGADFINETLHKRVSDFNRNI